MAASSVTDELTLLERVFLRIGSAETDDQLQNAISKFLPPVLLKLSSQQEGVRKKVMELLIHINKRVKSRPLVQLPVEALLVQYQDPAASSFVTNFTILYIKLGYPRLPIARQAELVASVLHALEGKPESHQDSLLLVLMPVLGHVSVPAEPARRASLFGLNEKPHVAAQLAEFMLDMLLLPYGAMVPQEDPAGGAPVVAVPAGMSEYGFKRVTGETPLKPEEIEQTKMGIVKFIAGGVLPDADILSHLVVAVADTRFNVANAADMEIKKIVGSLDWSSVAVVSPLFHLFLGTTLLRSNSKTQPKTRKGKEEYRRKPANTRIRLKVMPYLLRARGQAVMFPDCIQVFFDCLYGTMTNPRLKTMALQFSMLIIDNATKDRLTTVSTILCSGLLKLIGDEGTDRDLKMLAYAAVGKLGCKIPHLVNKDLALLQTFFNALSQEDQNTRMSIREALLGLADAFKVEDAPAAENKELQLSALAVNPPKDFVPRRDQPSQSGESSGSPQSDDAETKDKRPRFEDGVLGSLRESQGQPDSSRRTMLLALLASQIEASEPMARFVAVRYVAAIFPSDDAPSRYLLLLASGDSKDEVFTEALRALYGLTRRGQSLDKVAEDADAVAKKLPEFPAMVRCVAAMAEQRLGNAATRYTQGGHQLPFPPNTYTEILTYLRKCLASSAGVPGLRAVVHPSESSPLIGRYLRRLGPSPAVDQFLALAQGLMAAQPGAGSIACMLEAVGCMPAALAPRLADKLSQLKVLLSSTKEEVRESAALLYGVVLAHGVPDQAYQQSVTELTTATGAKLLETQHGAILALAHALERKLTAAGGGGGQLQGHREGVEAVVALLDHPHALIVGASCTAVGHLARCAPLPLSDAAKLALVNTLLGIVNNSKLTSTKVKERAAMATGLLCVGEEFKYGREIIDSFLKMAKETKDVEVHFTAGEALVCCVQGVRSVEARDAWTVTEAEHRAAQPAPSTCADLDYLMEQLLTKYAVEPHPNARQASCIWLLALVKHCAASPAVTSRLEAAQRAFMDLLSENSDIVQDVASKGLALVYDSSDEELRKRLVADLLDQLASGRRAVAQVTSDTKLFEEGQLGKAPTGGNLSTYKELCSLASDLNQPDLIYKFMHLANHNAIWNSKKGAAFGFFSIAASAGDQLAEHLPRIVPRLYRYQFDPTPKIQDSMTSIWHSLVPESNKTIELYHKEIFADLISNLTAGQWRVRISCCLALSDFLRSAAGNTALHDCAARLPELWTQLFRVMDDVHEGTRTAAGNTIKVLSKLCVRLCDVSHGKSGNDMVMVILPVILNVGITNTVPEVRSISLLTMSQLVTSAGSLLKPHLSLLIPALLEATGELESRGLTQLSVQYGAEQRTQEVIDAVRASAAKSHYTTETVVKCLQYIDAAVLDELIPKVVDLMKSSVGLGTRVACAHLIVLLVSHMKQELQPHTGRLLAALVNGLTDRNAAVRKCYATTIGHLATTAKDSSVTRLMAKLRLMYLEKEDETARTACAHTLQALGVHSHELLRDNASVVAPLAFYAMHAPKTDGGSVEAWEEVWGEVTQGTESGIRLHIAEICTQLRAALESPSWTAKAQAANAVATVATKAGPGLAREHRMALLDTLLAGLAGRTWRGKEDLLKALATLCSSCKESLRGEEGAVGAVVEAVLRESRKEQVDYKTHALRALGDILQALDADRFDDVYAIVKVTLDKDAAGKDSDDDEDSATVRAKRESLLELKEVVYETLGKAWPSNPQTQVGYREPLLEQCVTCLSNSTRPVQVAVVAALRCYVDKLTLLTDAPDATDAADEEALARILDKTYAALAFALGVTKHTRLRKEALNVLYLLGKRLKASSRDVQLRRLADRFRSQLAEVGRDNAPEVKSRVVDIKELLDT